MNALLDAALAYAARGIPVYPAHWPRPIMGGARLGCSCPRGPECDRPAKHPLVRHGVNDATTNQAQLKRWWQRWPDANIGLATGVVFDALDVDGPAGVAALSQLACTANLRLHGPLVRTGGGGWHSWFAPTGLGNRPPHGLAHVDWRGRGGCARATQPACLRPTLPLAARPRPGPAARGPDCPPCPARPRPGNDS
jgi:hypothetical protein